MPWRQYPQYLSSGLSELSGLAMVAPLAERLGMPEPYTERWSWGGGEY